MDIGKRRKDLSSVEFDTRTKAVMARSGGHENIREKINAVRLVVNNKSNNEIVLVLQQFDFSVDKTVQAFVDGRANEVLNEWNTTGKKKPNSKKKKGRGKGASEAAREEVEPEPVPREERDGENGDEVVVMAGEVAVVAGELVAVAGEEAVVAGSTAAIADGAAVMVVDGGVVAHNGDGAEGLAEKMDEILLLDKEGSADSSRPRSLDITHAVESAHDEPRETSEDVSQPKPSTGRTPPKQTGHSTVQHGGRHRGPRPAQRNANTAPHPQLAMFPEEPFSHPTSNSKKPGPNIEKSVKDLQRCMASLTRYRLLLKEEMDTSVKKIKSSFYELQQCLMDREVSLLSDIDKVKEEAIRLLKARQEKAGDLKRRTDNSVRMSEAQLASLRADIKQFVSERKYDEELSKTLRFVCDCESMKLALQTFGEVGQPKNSFVSKPRSDSVSSQSSVTPVTTPSDVSAPVMPLLSLPQGRTHASWPATGNDGSITTQGAAQSTDRKPGSAPPFQEPNGSHYGGRGGRTSQSSRGFRRNARNVPPRQDGLHASGYQRNPPRDRPRSQGQTKPESQTSTATDGKPQNGPGEPQRALDSNQHTKRTEEIRPKVTEGHRGKHSEERHKRADGSAGEQLQVGPSEVALPPRKPRHRPEASSSTRAPLRDGCGGGSLQQNGVAAPEVPDRRAGYSDEWGC
ncbi:spermatogenesis-associated serine-rich protein 2-like isoform X2 [Petromyzon marinus]|uniref:spermatogenesis-associated serine-rich protein 2-like isoform X2 n=1 Tax=Petromyzon marinus TaxID=7757 RepID=UPI003F712B58